MEPVRYETGFDFLPFIDLYVPKKSKAKKPAYRARYVYKKEEHDRSTRRHDLAGAILEILGPVIAEQRRTRSRPQSVDEALDRIRTDSANEVVSIMARVMRFAASVENKRGQPKG